MEKLQAIFGILLLLIATGATSVRRIVIDKFVELNENTFEEVLNVTLDVDNGEIPESWDISQLETRLMEYYNSSSEFLQGQGEDKSCSDTFSKLPGVPSLENVEGIWVSCENAEETATISYRMIQLEGFRTLNIRYYLHEGAALRLTISGTCYDYSASDTNSNCEYVSVGNSGQWQKLHYSKVEEPSYSFTRFTIEMISTSPNDYVLIDKVYASVYLHCGEDDPTECLRPTTTIKPTSPITFPTISTIVPPVTPSTPSTTPFDNCTDTTAITSEATTTNATTSTTEASTIESSTSTVSETITSFPSRSTTEEEASTSPSNSTATFSTTGCAEVSTDAPSAGPSVCFVNFNIFAICLFVYMF